jgi:hypothetical protein
MSNSQFSLSKTHHGDEPTNRSTAALMCPSAAVEMSGSVIFGIVIGTAEEPHLVHLDRVIPVPPELLAIDSPIEPTEIFRVAANCSEGACQHYDGANCRLTQRIVEGLPTVADRIPACAIRSTCRWWHQEGAAACLRCQQIVRDNYVASEELIYAIEPKIHDR